MSEFVIMFPNALQPDVGGPRGGGTCLLLVGRFGLGRSVRILAYACERAGRARCLQTLVGVFFFVAGVLMKLFPAESVVTVQER